MMMQKVMFVDSSFRLTKSTLVLEMISLGNEIYHLLHGRRHPCKPSNDEEKEKTNKNNNL